MALNSSRGGTHKRRPSFKGRAYSRIWRGIEISQNWPRKRGKNLHPKTKAQMEFFRQVQWAFKYSDALVQRSYAESVKATPLMPRDLFLMAVSGRMHALVLPNGKVMWPMAAVRSVSDSLDVLAQLPGNMIVRGADVWQGLPAGAPGDVLASVGADQPPAWTTMDEALAPVQVGPLGGPFDGSNLTWHTGNLQFGTGLNYDPLTGLLEATGGGGGSAAWNLILAQHISSPTANIDVDISAYGEVLLIGRNVTCAANAFRGCLLSTNGGASYFNTTAAYANIGTTGGETGTFIILNHGTATTVARDFGGTLKGLRQANMPKLIQDYLIQTIAFFIGDMVNPVTHMRICAMAASGGALINMTGGDVWVLAR